MTINFNTTPYNDDFDSSKNFLKLLFKAGYPVQARELNTIQSLLQNQIGVFANHMFKNGSKISNCRTSIVYRNYVRLMPNFLDENEDVDLSLFNTTYRCVGEVSGVEGQFVFGINAEQNKDGDIDPATMYVIYDQTGMFEDEEQTEFVAGEPISIIDEKGVVIKRVLVRCPGCPDSNLSDEIKPNGIGAFFAIDEGHIYYNKYFIQVERQEIVLIKYLKFNNDNIVISDSKFKIGLDFVEDIVTAEDDNSLYDNALGYPNYSAEGADRYRGSLKLVVRSYDLEDGDNFILLAKVLNGLQVEFVKADAEYGQINEEFARRTYEQAGDFTLAPFKTKFYEAKKTATNGSHGWSETGKEKDLVAVVSPSIAYVKGYRHETKADTVVTFEKARDTEFADNIPQFLPSRTFMSVEVVSTNHIVAPNSSTNILSNVELHLYNGDVSGGNTTGENIGFVKVIDQSIESFNDKKYNIYIYDITITKQGATFGDVKSCKTISGNFVAKVKQVDNVAFIGNVNNTALIYKINKDYIKSLRNIENKDNGDTNIYVRRKLIGTTDSNGRITFNAQGNESFLPYNPNDCICYIGVANTPSTMYKLTNTNYITTGDSLTIDASPTNANMGIVVYVNIQKVNQLENQKIVDLKTFTPTNDTIVGTIGDKINLGVADAFLIKSIKLVEKNPSSSNPVEPIDITSDYKLVNNQTDMYYKESYIERVKTRNIGTGQTIIISVYYFKHEGNAGFFTIDSYSQLLDEENEWGLSYGDIPTHKLSNGEEIRLSDAIDFRPIFMDGEIRNTTILPVQSSTAIFDIEYYLPRIDLLSINSEGQLYVKKGNASLSPNPPKADNNAMGLYQIHLKPYTFDIKDVNVKFIENKRYTMRDIGNIESRVEKLEYYQTLSILEQDTINMNIKDSDGFDRYKNGILVDSFKNYNAGDLLNKEFNATIDSERGELRPIAVPNSNDLEIDLENSVNLTMRGKMGYLPYDEVAFQENPYATKHISINPYLVYNKKGSLTISPNIDTWSDTNYLPDLNMNIDTGVEALRSVADASGLLGSHFGSWSDLNTTTQLSNISTMSIESISNNPRLRGTLTTVESMQVGTIVSTSQRELSSTTIDARTNQYTIDNIVKDVSIQPYIRSRIVQFYGSRMKPNRTVYAFFDGVDVSKHCKLIENIIYDGMNVEYIRKQSVFGGIPLKTDENGEIRGEFRIPPNTFFTGEKTFVLTDDINNTGNNDVATTTAQAVYFAGGINQSKQNANMNVITPEFNSFSRTEQQTITQTITSRGTTTNTVVKDISDGGRIMSNNTVVDPTPPQKTITQWESWWSSDPVAQSFVVDESCFITRLDLYFKEVDMKSSDTIWVELRTMVNGYPTTTALTRKEYTPNDILNFVSDNSEKAFTVIFDNPVYVDANISYCFVIGGYSPDTRLWISHLGEEVVNMKGKTVEEPPTPFSSFRSINGETWNAEQYENIKHKLYRAVFKSKNMKVKLRNKQNIAPLKLDANPIEIESGRQRVRIHAKNHGVTVTDRVSISLFDNIPFIIEVGNTTPPQITQLLTTPTGSGIVNSVELVDDSANRYKITLINIKGKFEIDQQFNVASKSKEFNDKTLMANNGNRVPSNVMLNESNGYIKTIPSIEGGANTIGSGGLELFNIEHIVVEVDSIDSFIVEIAHSFNATGRFGGNNGVAFDISRRYEMYNISGAYLPYGATENFTLAPIQYNDLNTLDKKYNFTINTDYYSPHSLKILSPKNELRVFGSGANSRRSVDITLNFESQSPYLSPVINTDSFSMITISNRVGDHNKDKLNVSPNASNKYISEEDSQNGNSKFKYVTKRVLLKDPASDIKIYLDVYKDVNSDFDIYVKPIEIHEVQDEENVEWILLDHVNKNAVTSNINEKIEYEVDASMASGWKSNLEFIAFRVKLVGKTTNPAKPPIFSSLRTIAVT